MSLSTDIKSFLSVPFNLYLTAFLLILGLGVYLFQPGISDTAPGFIEGDAELTIHFFHSISCPHCAAQKLFNVKLAEEFPQIKFIYHDIDTQEGAKLILGYYNKFGIDNTSLFVPATFINKQYLIGFDNEKTSGEKLRQMIKDELGNGKSGEKTDDSASPVLEFPIIGKINVAEYSLPALAIILGLIDGFNPCAMWVLVYLISIVLTLKDRSRLWLIVGSFVLASGILYFLFMTAWLNAFLFIGYFRPVTIVIGLVALGGAILSFKEFIKDPFGSLECKVGDVEEKKKTMNSIQQIVSAPMTWATLAGIIMLAFAINSVEFVCSAAIPAVFTQVLALSNLSGLEYYLYILLYTLFFMLDDLLIFSLAAFAISSDFGQKYAGWCKLIGAIIMLLLGMMLLFAPNMLA